MIAHLGGAARAIAGLGLLALAISGCASRHQPANHSPLFDLEKTAVPGRDEKGPNFVPVLSQTACAPPGTPQFLVKRPSERSRAVAEALTLRYSVGDRFNLQVPGSPEFTGDYAINPDGKVNLPFAGDVRAAGLTNQELVRVVEQAFVRARLFQPDGFKVALRPVQYAAINVSVSGAVFLPGRFQIGNREEDKGDRGLGKFGDRPLDRSISSAMKSAGGVRPDADVTKIRVHRAGKVLELDWQGAMTGGPVDDVPLLDGDHIEVRESGCFQSALVRPSQLTVGGIRLFLSNLSAPANNNAGAAVTRDSMFVPYGTRLLQGLVSAACIGGIIPTNARRHAVLISRNPKTHRTEVIQRSVEQLVLSPDRDEINPYLMPDDAIACYDSDVTATRDIAALIQQIIVPGATIKGSN